MIANTTTLPVAESAFSARSAFQNTSQSGPLSQKYGPRGTLGERRTQRGQRTSQMQEQIAQVPEARNPAPAPREWVRPTSEARAETILIADLLKHLGVEKGLGTMALE